MPITGPYVTLLGLTANYVLLELLATTAAVLAAHPRAKHATAQHLTTALHVLPDIRCSTDNVCKPMRMASVQDQTWLPTMRKGCVTVRVSNFPFVDLWFDADSGCPAKCTACKIPNFDSFSPFSQLQCTGCIPGFVLSQGQCVSQCPNGTFLGSDNLTCTRESNQWLPVTEANFIWQHATPRVRLVSATPSSV
jgi:hypothetical protein